METPLLRHIKENTPHEDFPTDLLVIVYKYLVCCSIPHKEKLAVEGCSTCIHDVCACSKESCSYRYCGAMVHADCSPAVQFNWGGTTLFCFHCKSSLGNRCAYHLQTSPCCSVLVCDVCLHSCDQCRDKVCYDCLDRCRCQRWICVGCLRFCRYCETPLCGYCALLCETCSTSICAGCMHVLNENGIFCSPQCVPFLPMQPTRSSCKRPIS